MNVTPNDLVLIRGLPGSGKSTKARGIQAQSDLQVYVFEADDFFTMSDGRYIFDSNHLRTAHRVCRERTKLVMRYTNNPVIVANTFTTRSEITPYRELAETYRYSVTEIVCTGEFGSIHDVPISAIDRMKNRWED